MKYRYKVLIINMIVISIALSLSGFILMSRNNSMMMESQAKNAVVENNLAQSVIEYSLLDVINSGSSVAKRLPEIGDEVSAGMLTDTSDLFIRYDNDILFSTNASSDINADLFSHHDGIKKNYIISRENKDLYIYVTSFGAINDKTLNIITRRNITETEVLMNKNVHDYMLFTIIILMLSGILVYIISYLLTRPLEKLNRVTDAFAEGDFSARSDISSDDEVGLLSDKFNDMASSVEDHIDELNDMLHRRDQFVADFTHEIKTPMTAIIGYADTIRSVDLSREEEIHAASYIFSEGKRLEQMSMKLFDLLYIKDHHIEKTPCSTTSIGEDVVTSVTPLLKEADMKLKYHFDNAVVTCEPGLIKTVLINLIDNAKKASEEKAVIEVYGSLIDNNIHDNTNTSQDNNSYYDSDGNIDTYSNNSIENNKKSMTKQNTKNIHYKNSRQNEQIKQNTAKNIQYYKFTVKDHGIGIPQEDIDRICDEFYMVDKSRSRGKGGAGLGLSLANIILQEHDSRLEIESEVGEGTTMSFILKIDPGNESRTQL